MDNQQLIQQLEQLQKSNFNSEDERTQTISALQAALTRIQTPWETAFDIVYIQPAQAAALKFSYDIGLFTLWYKSFPDGPATEEELARVTGVDGSLLSRMLRHLSTTRVIERVGCSGQYALTEFSKALARTELTNMIPFLYNTTLPGFTNLPSFLESTDYRTPDSSSRTNWHHMRGASRFNELQQSPHDMKIFQTVMAMNTREKSALVDMIPIEELLRTTTTTNDEPNTVFWVDVGGGLGHDIVNFHELLLKEKVEVGVGSLVLQDIAVSVEEDSDTSESQAGVVKMMKHDFFQEQPIKGAGTYYLHTVLHDWTDERAIAILRQLALAARPGRSRILIHEIVMTDKSSARSTSQDMVMMMALSSRERTEAEWYQVVEEGAGLEIVKVWSSASSIESVIEAKVPVV